MLILEKRFVSIGSVDEKNVQHQNCFNRNMVSPRICDLRRALPAIAAMLVAALLLLTACARKKPARPAIAPVLGALEFGVASWYGNPYHGRRAANGEVYDMEKLTAAHRTLPFNCWVEVLNLANNKSVRVRITDRGPFVASRIIDLSRAAARQIEMIGPGTAQVRLQVIAPPEMQTGEDSFAVQVGAFQDRGNAERLAEEMKNRFGESRLVLRDGSPQLWRVLVGREQNLDAANALAEKIRTERGAAFVVRLDPLAGDRL